jgi:hypothetical protein
MSAILGTSVTGAGAAGAYAVDNSLRFRSSASAYLNRTPATTGSRTTWTWSGWVKRGSLGSIQTIFSARIDGGNYFRAGFTAADKFNVDGYYSGLQRIFLTTTQVFRDPSAWYHIMFVANSTNATSTDRFSKFCSGMSLFFNFMVTISPGVKTFFLICLITCLSALTTKALFS